MGLTRRATGRYAVDRGLYLRSRPEDRVIALAGNPNVGKSTVFNGLTGLHQHTGNWPGKTVANAQGRCTDGRRNYIVVDIPGAYSLSARSAEEQVARSFLCFGRPDAAVVVCDATCLERSLHLVLQVIETGLPVVVCVNLLDEAKRRGLTVDVPALSRRLGVPVVGTVAQKKSTLRRILRALGDLLDAPGDATPLRPVYSAEVEAAAAQVEDALQSVDLGKLDRRWVALRLLEGEPDLLDQLEETVGQPLRSLALPVDRGLLEQDLAETLHLTARAICAETVTQTAPRGEGRLDRIFTGRWTAFPVLLLLLAVIFYLTMAGANVPSSWLASLFDRGGVALNALLSDAPDWVRSAVVDGVYGVLSSVVSVMLPPMAIFFPLFTLLEDSGYLPRVAYVLDKPFEKCRACGKQALTMMMGFGCNAAGVVGCRIIDSPRERLLAMLTNNLVPCNGRFPTLLALSAIFFAGRGGMVPALLVTGFVVLGVGLTFLLTWMLSRTVLKGVPSSYVLELPAYRRPQVGQVVVRSLLDRTLFVLGRAVAVAAPAGLILWLLAHWTVGGVSMLNHAAAFLDPVGRFLGMDGVILLAFLLGFPANEIVIPIAVMIYQAQGALSDTGTYAALGQVLTDNGWTWVTALCVLLFSLCHWPCSTTLLTIRKESGSWKWALLAALAPTTLGVVLCALVNVVLG